MQYRVNEAEPIKILTGNLIYWLAVGPAFHALEWIFIVFRYFMLKFQILNLSHLLYWFIQKSYSTLNWAARSIPLLKRLGVKAEGSTSLCRLSTGNGQTLKGFENGFERKQDLDGN